MPKQIFQRPQPVNRSNFGKPGKTELGAPVGPGASGAVKGQRLGKGGKPMPPKPAKLPGDGSPGNGH